MVEAVAIPAPVCVWMRCGDMGPPARDDGGWYTSIGTQRRCLEHAGWSDTEGYCWGEIILVSNGAADADDERRGDALKRLGVVRAVGGRVAGRNNTRQFFPLLLPQSILTRRRLPELRLLAREIWYLTS